MKNCNGRDVYDYVSDSGLTIALGLCNDFVVHFSRTPCEASIVAECAASDKMLKLICNMCETELNRRQANK